MVTVLPPVEKGPTFGQKLGLGIGRGLEMGSQMYQQHQQKQAVEQLMGKDVSNLPPEFQKLAYEYALMGQLEKQKMGKGLNPLQEAQKNLSEEKLRALQGQQNLSNRLFGGKTSQTSPETGETTQQTTSPLDLSKIPEEQLRQGAAFAGQQGEMGILGNMYKGELEKREKGSSEKRKSFESDREYHSKLSDPIIKGAMDVLKEVPIKKGLIDQQRRDISSGQTSGIIPFLVEKTGLETYRNPESARFKTASKQRFIENLHSLAGGGARPNQFIEQQLVGAQANLGRDPESNLTVLDLEEFVDDLKNQRAKYELDLAEQDRERLGFARNDIGIRAEKKMKDYVEQRQDQMAYDIRKRHEDKLDEEKLTREVIGNHVPPDTPLTLRVARILMIKNNDDEKKAQAEAKGLGYKIPHESVYLRD